jgi:hypothetical protein
MRFGVKLVIDCASSVSESVKENSALKGRFMRCVLGGRLFMITKSAS